MKLSDTQTGAIHILGGWTGEDLPTSKDLGVSISTLRALSNKGYVKEHPEYEGWFLRDAGQEMVDAKKGRVKAGAMFTTALAKHNKKRKEAKDVMNTKKRAAETEYNKVTKSAHQYRLALSKRFFALMTLYFERANEGVCCHSSIYPDSMWLEKDGVGWEIDADHPNDIRQGSVKFEVLLELEA